MFHTFYDWRFRYPCELIDRRLQSIKLKIRKSCVFTICVIFGIISITKHRVILTRVNKISEWGIFWDSYLLQSQSLLYGNWQLSIVVIEWNFLIFPSKTVRKLTSVRPINFLFLRFDRSGTWSRQKVIGVFRSSRVPSAHVPLTVSRPTGGPTPFCSCTSVAYRVPDRRNRIV